MVKRPVSTALAAQERDGACGRIQADYGDIFFALRIKFPRKRNLRMPFCAERYCAGGAPHKGGLKSKPLASVCSAALIVPTRLPSIFANLDGASN